MSNQKYVKHFEFLKKVEITGPYSAPYWLILTGEHEQTNGKQIMTSLDWSLTNNTLFMILGFYNSFQVKSKLAHTWTGKNTEC
jgi:hypothetical protein